MKTLLSLLFLALSLMIGPAQSSLPGKGMAQHDFLYSGEWDTRKTNQTMFLVEGGDATTVEWKLLLSECSTCGLSGASGFHHPSATTCPWRTNEAVQRINFINGQNEILCRLRGNSLSFGRAPRPDRADCVSYVLSSDV